MIEPEFTRVTSMIASNAALLASAAAIAAASAAYVLCSMSARRTNAQFSLGKLEEFELERAVLLYEKAVDRLQDIRNEGRQIQAGLLARYRHQKQIRRKFAAELQDLQSYAAHLRSMIVRLRSGPIQRAWFSVLGVSRSATMDEIKQAYKVRVKQNHPDRVRQMSPLFRELAEAETKKLNAAYEEALMSLQRA